MKLVSPDRNAVKELSGSPGMTIWSYNMPSWLTERRNRIQAQQGRKCQTGQVDQWGRAEQVLGRAGTEGALTIFHRCKKCGLGPKTISFWFFVRKREPAKSHTARTSCCCAYCGASSAHETGICMVYQAEYPPQGSCKSATQAVLLGKSVHEEGVSSHTD